MHVAVVGNLAHHVVDAEFIGAVLRTRDQRQRLDHERALLVGGHRAMVTEHGHRRVARIAIEDRELKWVNEVGVPLRVIAQFAQFTFRHRDKLRAQQDASRTGTARDMSMRAIPYLEGAAAGAAIAGDAAAFAGAAIAGDAAAIGAIGISLPLLACDDDLVAALAAAFAWRLQR